MAVLMLRPLRSLLLAAKRGVSGGGTRLPFCAPIDPGVVVDVRHLVARNEPADARD